MLLHCDGFDHIQNLSWKYYTYRAGWDAVTVYPGRYDYGMCYRQMNTGFGETNHVHYVGTQSAVIVGLDFAAYSGLGISTPTYTANNFLRLDTSRGDPYTVCSVAINSQGKLEFWVGGAGHYGQGSKVAEGSDVFGMEVWHHLELLARVSGGWELRLNGATYLQGSDSLNPHGDGDIGTVTLRWESFGFAGMQADNYTICNTEGTVCNTFLGPCRVLTYYPIANYGPNQWNKNAGVWNYDRVYERRNYPLIGNNFPDGDSSYIYSTIDSNLDVYDFEDVANGTLIGVAPATAVRCIDASGVYKVYIYNEGSASSWLSSNVTARAAASWSTDARLSPFCTTLMLSENPIGYIPWTAGAVNSSRWGIRKVSGGGVYGLRCTQYALQCLYQLLVPGGNTASYTGYLIR